MSYSQLADILLSSNRELDKCLENIKVVHPNLSETLLEKIKEDLKRNFLPKFSKRWHDASRNKKTFVTKNADWLKNELQVIEEENEPGPSKRSRGGRTEKSFEDCCDRTKRYKTRSLSENYPEEMIIKAANRFQSQPIQHSVFSPEKALALMLDASLSKHQYEILRRAAKDVGCDIFPEYRKVLESKKQCYPAEIDVTKSFACIGLQSLLDHTTQRIFETKTNEELLAMSEETTLLTKWGCDGSSGHSEYKQTFVEENVSDSNMFLTSIVPLRLQNKEDHFPYWENKTPSSVRSCRPVAFQYVKETTEATVNEIARMESEIANLNETIVSLNGNTFKVTHELLFTMIDGKIAQTLTETQSNAVCFICKAKPTEMNNLEEVRKKAVNKEAYRVGLSPLHARIKFMECILHISYNKGFCDRRTNTETRPQKEAEKKRIQEELFRELGIKVDFVKQGMGSTNDGNTSRRFFGKPEKVAEITGVNKDLIHRFSIILQAINSGAMVDAEKFGKYCAETANIYVHLYSWYYKPNTVHKVLVHGSSIISAAVLPVGMLTEEAQEARNKDYRKYRLYHSRKCSRESSNTDILHALLASSDPYINNVRSKPKTHNIPLHEDVLELLVDTGEE